MSEFEIIDAHVHLYRDLDLERKNVRITGRRDRDRWGNPESVVKFMDAQGISKIVFLPNFPTRQMRAKLEQAVPASASEDERTAAFESIRLDLAERVRRQNE
jgi:predicted TIM-barrel fold metal-dependent hydrolase